MGVFWCLKYQIQQMLKQSGGASVNLVIKVENRACLYKEFTTREFMLQVTALQRNFLHHLLVLASRPSTRLDGLLQFILERALAVTSSDVGGGIFLVEPASQAYRLVASVLRGKWADTPTNLFEQWKQNPTSPALFVLQSGRPYTCHDSREDQAHFPLLAGSQSSLWVPLLEGKRVIGVLHVESSLPGYYSEQHQHQVEGLAAEAIPAIHRLLLREQMVQIGALLDMVGISPAFMNLERQIMVAAASARGSVFITGERGSGKELTARAIHFWSDRRNQPFVPVLASAFSESLSVDELFGHERHAFTGAASERAGKFKAAEGGTIFLDEIADMSPTIQSALLRVIERGELPRIGRDLPLQIDVRVIAATNRNLPELMAQGQFRVDLFDRLSIFEIRVPPLRERQEDIPLLTSHFLRKYCQQMKRYLGFEDEGGCGICHQSELVCCASAEFYEALQAYDWPGNVRELENLILRLLATVPDEILDTKDLPERFRHVSASLAKHRSSSDCPPFEDLTIESAMRKHLRYVLQLTAGNKSRAAKILGIPRTTLLTMIKKFKP